MGTLVFMTNFEDVTWKDSNSLYIKDLNSPYYMANWIVLQNGAIFLDDGDERPDSPSPHSGGLMVGGEFTSSSSGTKRAQLDLKFYKDSSYGSGYPPTPWIQDQYFMDAYLYLDPNWALRNSSDNWASLCTIHNNEAGEISHQFVLTVRTRQNPPTTADHYKLCIGAVGESHTGGPVETTTDTWNLFNVRGKWNHLQIYCKRGNTAVNWCTVWWDGVKILDGGAWPSLDYTLPWFVSFPKVYSNTSGINRQWVDDVEFWDGLPGSAPPSKSGSFDGLLTGTRSKSGSLDGNLKFEKTVSGSLDAIATTAYSQSGFLDALLQQQLSASGSLDGYLISLKSIIGEFDALLKLEEEKGGSVDGYLQDTLTKSGTYDAVLDMANIVGSFDGMLELSTETLMRLGLLQAVIDRMEKYAGIQHVAEPGLCVPGMDTIKSPMVDAIKKLKTK